MKNLIHKVELSIEEDYASGIYGLAKSQDRNYGFNSFWSGIGIFHDVFEHWFEGTHKYFQGENAYNVGGEMAAMGAAMYFIDEMGVSRRDLRGPLLYSESIRNTTQSEIMDAIYNGNCNYGDELLCGVPYQRPTDNSYLEDIPKKMLKEIRETRFSPNRYSTEGEKLFSANYKKSVTVSKVKRLHRYGYRMAQRKFGPSTHTNMYVLGEFIKFWDNFCTTRSGEDLYHDEYRSITFRVYKDHGDLSWTATVEPSYASESKPIKISSNNLNY